MWRLLMISGIVMVGLCRLGAQPVRYASLYLQCDEEGRSWLHPDQRYLYTAHFLDAAINSINAFNSLVKKENYRVKVVSFNNPASTDMGFSLENEIQTALKPMLLKTRTVNPSKFSQVVSVLINSPAQVAGTQARAGPLVNPLFATLLSVVSTLTVQEKRLGRDDLDSFIGATSRYIVQYEKLYNANLQFDQHLERVHSRLKELQFDMKEYMLDLITILYGLDQRAGLKTQNSEELFLQYLDKVKMEAVLKQRAGESLRYPSDALKGAKDIAYTIQKLFSEYQKVYEANYQQIRTILAETRLLGKNINTGRIDTSLKELQELYTESSASDALGLRLNTLTERLKALVATEQD